MGETTGNNARTSSRSELRLAVTFTGGVSLAVWMGGIAREMNLLLAAGNAARNTAGNAGEASAVQAKYRELLDLVDLDVSIDVLSGTSAGGINAAFLGLANARGCDLGSLRDLWLDQGSLGLLLRDPAEKSPPSLLKGDDVLLAGLRAGLNAVMQTADAESERPTTVFITTTLLDGVESPFEDNYGTAIRDTDHRGLFTFTTDQLSSGHLAALALAARASASFPGAFEPAFLPMGAADGENHPDMRPYTSVELRTQFCADGGLLANRPLGPALQAIFDRPAHDEVRRVLAYVVPSPGVAPAEPPEAPRRDRLPALGAALLKDLNAALSQSISADLNALTAHNRRVAAQKRSESLLAPFLEGADTAALQHLYGEYRARRIAALAHAAANETLAQLAAHGRRAADDRPVGFGEDLDRLADAAATAIEQRFPADLPAPGADVFQGLARFGRPALDAAKATVLRLIREGSAAVPDASAAMGELAGRVHGAMPERGVRRLSEAIRTTLEGAGTVIEDIAGSDAWLTAARSQLPDADEVALLATAWMRVAETAAEIGPALAGPGPVPHALSRVLAYVSGPGDEGAAQVQGVARRLFVLHIGEQTVSPEASPTVRQRVELVQVSADTRTLLDARSLAAQKLTGLQFHHFGAFYKRSWRANDWMWGRLDGAGWLVHLLLSPPHVARLAEDVRATDEEPVEGLRTRLAAIAGADPPREFADGIQRELRRVAGGRAAPLPASLPLTSMWVATGLQRLIAAEELPCVAEQARRDQEDGAARTAETKNFLDAYDRHPLDPRAPDTADPETVEDLLHACKISAETFATERATAMLTRTVVQSAAVATNAAEAGTTRWKPVRPLFGTLGRTLRLTHLLLTSDRAARTPLTTGLLLLVGGVLAATSSLTVISAVGIVLLLAGVIVLTVGVPTEKLKFAIGALTVTAIAVFVAAAAIPFVRDPLFDWFGDVITYLHDHAWAWALVAAVLLLPPAWTVYDLGRSLRRPRGERPATEPQTDQPPPAPPGTADAADTEAMAGPAA
jgi:patatin-related protein